jgi:hypothetical protein
MAWNREHAGLAAAPAVAIDWSVTGGDRAVGVGGILVLRHAVVVVRGQPDLRLGGV